VYLIPGIGAQRRSSNAVALAELAYRNGYSVAVVSSPFHPEFIETGLSSTYPGFTPEDASDLLAALSALDTQLRREHPDGLLDARLLGYSLGAIEALFVADLERAAGSDALHFTHVMAINSPVDLRYSAEGFDLFYDAPLQWPESERRGRLVELAMKALLVAQDKDAARKPLPVDRIESEFLIGLSGRATVVEALSAIERRGGSDFQITPDVAAEQGRAAAELNASSLANYADRLAVPYFSESKGLDRDALLAGASLRSREASLRADPRIRALTNENDFILGPENLAWLRGVLGPRLTVFPDGGHLGNLSRADVQSAILEGLGTPTDAAVMPCPENSAVAGGPRVDGAGEIERCIDGGDVRELQLHE
jgi:hypothetical protein